MLEIRHVASVHNIVQEDTTGEVELTISSSVMELKRQREGNVLKMACLCTAHELYFRNKGKIKRSAMVRILVVLCLSFLLMIPAVYKVAKWLF